MALDAYSLALLAQVEFASVLSLGYPDIVVSAKRLEMLTGIHVEQSSTKGAAWHTKRFPLPDTREFFAKKNAVLTCVDFKQHKGDEIIADLNFPQDLGQFDLVIDPGTIEHCFNIAQAAMTAAQSVKVGGHILHVNPISMVNHGFYNLCPTWYFDFYGDNGFEVIKCFGLSDGDAFDLHPMRRMRVAAESAGYVLVQRTDERTLRYPVQGKYRI